MGIETIGSWASIISLIALFLAYAYKALKSFLTYIDSKKKMASGFVEGVISCIENANNLTSRADATSFINQLLSNFRYLAIYHKVSAGVSFLLGLVSLVLTEEFGIPKVGYFMMGAFSLIALIDLWLATKNYEILLKVDGRLVQALADKVDATVFNKKR